MIKDFLKSRFVRFSIVGFSGTIVDIGISNLLRFVFHIPEIPSITLSFILAVLNNFHWNRVWTYPEFKNQQTIPQLIKFAVISVIGYIIRTPLFAVFEKPIVKFSSEIVEENLPFDANIIGHNLTLMLVIVIVLIWNYLANRIWTYRNVVGGNNNET